jgi:hypothetical protein
VKILKKVKPRKFEVITGPNKIYVKHCADIYLKENEQITFKSFT